METTNTLLQDNGSLSSSLEKFVFPKFGQGRKSINVHQAYIEDWGKGKTEIEVIKEIKKVAYFKSDFKDLGVLALAHTRMEVFGHSHALDLKYYSIDELRFLWVLGNILGFVNWNQVYAYMKFTGLTRIEVKKRLSSIDNRIKSRIYTSGKPATTSHILYIIKTGGMVKFGITKDFLTRMKSYISDFGGYELIESIALDTRRVARDVEKEMIKYFKSLGKIIQGHEYTSASASEVKKIRDLMVVKVAVWAN